MPPPVGPILILDEIEVAPGGAAVYREALEDAYLPAALERGMTLTGSWRTPPVQDIEGVPTTLFFLWSVTDIDGWWRMRLSRGATGEDERGLKEAWWQVSDAMTIRRRRRILTPIDAGREP